MKPLSYSRYQSLGGQLPEASYDALKLSAADLVRYVVGINPTTDEEALERAFMAALGELSHGEGGFTLGSFRMNERTGQEMRNSAVEAAIRALTGTGMSYGGIA